MTIELFYPAVESIAYTNLPRTSINANPSKFCPCQVTGLFARSSSMIQAATIIERDERPIEIVGVDLVGMFASHSPNQLILIESFADPIYASVLVGFGIKHRTSRLLIQNQGFGPSFFIWLLASG